MRVRLKAYDNQGGAHLSSQVISVDALIRQLSSATDGQSLVFETCCDDNRGRNQAARGHENHYGSIKFDFFEDPEPVQKPRREEVSFAHVHPLFP